MNNRFPRKFLRNLVLVWFVLMVFYVLVLGMTAWYPVWKIVQHRVMTTAMVSHIDNDANGESNVRVAGNYDVAGKSYSFNLGSSYAPNPKISQIKAGNTVSITYDSTDPGAVVLGDARVALLRDTNLMLVIGIGMPSAFVILISVSFGLIQRTAKKNNQSASPSLTSTTSNQPPDAN